MSFSNYLEKAILDHINDQVAYMPTAMYLALYMDDPNEDNSGYEVDSTFDDVSYARQPISFAPADLVSGIALSSNSQTFAAVSYGSEGIPYTVTHIAILDDITGGNMLQYTALGANVARSTGKTMVFDVGAVTTALD